MYENETLKSSTSKQADELQMYQKASLTKDQTASLLQELKILEEKLDNAQKGKSFFKEQWGKAVREIHKMKVEHQQTMQVQIKNSKEELKNVEYVLLYLQLILFCKILFQSKTFMINIYDKILDKFTIKLKQKYERTSFFVIL